MTRLVAIAATVCIDYPCPYCETGKLERLTVVTPDVLYESETGGWYDVEAIS